MELERIPVKIFEVKAASAELKDNRIRVVPSVMGMIDLGGDVIFPGAFKKVIKSFLQTGFVADTHGWDMADLIAMPVSMQEQGNLLVSEAEFHSTQDAQNVRTKVRERLARNLSVGASIGFYTAKDGRAYFDNGEALLAYAEETGADLSLFDAKGIKAWGDWCRAITQVEKLYEYSIVPVPMMPAAGVTEAKAGQIATEREFERFLRDAGFSRTQAVAIAGHGWKGVAQQRDAESDTKGATGKTGFPLAERDRAWSASEADARIRKKTNATETPNSAYRDCHFWYDADNPDRYGSYKLLFCDVIDGQIRAVPRAIFACAAVMMGSRGGVDIPDADRAGVRSKIESYYARMRKEFNDDTIIVPWAEKRSADTEELAQAAYARFLEISFSQQRTGARL